MMKRKIFTFLLVLGVAWSYIVAIIMMMNQ